MEPSKLIAQVKHFFPNLENLEERLRTDTEGTRESGAELEFGTEPEPRTRSRGIVFGDDRRTPAEKRSGGSAIQDAEERVHRKAVEAGARAVRKIREGSSGTDMSEDEKIGLEVIVNIARPAIFIQGGKFFPPPEGWEVLEQHRARIETACRSVGRIEAKGHRLLYIGTGFLVGENVIMTNAHVAEEFCQKGQREKWQFKTGMMPGIDYIKELGATKTAMFNIENVIGVHDDFDLALFRVTTKSVSGSTAAEPLTLASDAKYAKTGRQVYVLGYPAFDSRAQSTSAAAMRAVFNDVYDVKRLQPGNVLKVLDKDALFRHDCSTLGGNSGSCVIDLETNQVLGLHYGGVSGEYNVAVSLWKRKTDPLLKKAKVNFGSAGSA